MLRIKLSIFNCDKVRFSIDNSFTEFLYNVFCLFKSLLIPSLRCEFNNANCSLYFIAIALLIFFWFELIEKLVINFFTSFISCLNILIFSNNSWFFIIFVFAWFANIAIESLVNSCFSLTAFIKFKIIF